MSRMIRVDEETHANLSSLKREGESFDDVINRLLSLRREDIRDGAGYWSEDEVAAAQEAVQNMKSDVGKQWSS